MLVLTLCWIALALPSLGWVVGRLSPQGVFTTSALSLIGAIVFAVQTMRVRRDPWGPPSPLAAFVLAVCAVIVVLQDRLLAFQTITWAAIVLGALVIAGWRDRRRQLIAVLLVLSIPTFEHLETYFGFAIRQATADVVARILRANGVMVASGQSVILFENGIADVAEACSGMKTLWTGALGITWLLAVRGARLSLRTIAVCAGALALLVACNGARVLCLVWLDHVAHAPVIAKVAHAPLGVFGFTAVMTAAFSLMPREAAVPPQPSTAIGRHASLWLSSFVVAAVMLRPLLTPADAAMLPLPATPVIAGAVAKPLDDKERALFQSHRARAFKYELVHEGRRAAVVIVVSDSFRAHHAPEVCARAHGHLVDRVRSERVMPELEVRTYLVDGGAQRGVYWFESAAATTDNLLDRTLARSGERWALVSLLVAGDALPSPAFLHSLRAAVAPLVQPPFVTSGASHGTENR